MTAHLVHRFALGLALSVTLAFGALFIGPTPTVSAFTGHSCTKATCQAFTSSYRGSKYYYRRCDRAWKGLSDRYLHGFKTSRALLARYPSRVLHKRC